MEFFLCPAGLAVYVDPNSRAPTAGRLLIDEARQDALMSADAGASGAFCLLIAVAADSAVGPSRDGLVVLAAAGAGGLASGWDPLACVAYSPSSGLTSRMRLAIGLPGWIPMSSLRCGAFAVAAARISTKGSNRSFGGAVQDVAERSEGPGRDALRRGSDQSVDLALRKVDAPGSQKRHQFGGFPEIALGHQALRFQR